MYACVYRWQAKGAKIDPEVEALAAHELDQFVSSLEVGEFR